MGDTSRDREEALGLALAFTERARAVHLGFVDRARQRVGYDRAYLYNTTESVRSAAKVRLPPQASRSIPGSSP